MPKARRVHFDIETCKTRNPLIINRLAREAEAVRPPQKATKTVTSEMIKLWDTKESIDERVRNAISETSKKPLYAEILTIGFKTENGDAVAIDAMDQPEQKALQLFHEAMSDLTDENTIWVAFNGKGFDLPVLANRMIKHGIKPPEHFPTFSRYWHGRIFDSMERIPIPEPMTSFSKICDVYGLPCKTIEWEGKPMDGSRVGEAFELGEYQIIRDYVKDDVINEEQLYLAMTHNDRWGTYDTAINDDLVVLKEIIDDAEMSHSRKWIASQGILNALTKGVSYG